MRNLLVLSAIMALGNLKPNINWHSVTVCTAVMIFVTLVHIQSGLHRLIICAIQLLTGRCYVIALYKSTFTYLLIDRQTDRHTDRQLLTGYNTGSPAELKLSLLQCEKVCGRTMLQLNNGNMGSMFHARTCEHISS